MEALLLELRTLKIMSLIALKLIVVDVRVREGINCVMMKTIMKVVDGMEAIAVAIQWELAIARFVNA